MSLAEPAPTSPLSLAETQAILSRVTYRPGWSFAVHEGRVEGNPALTGGLHLVIDACLPDAFSGHSDILLDIHVPLPPMTSEGELLRFLAWRLLRIEAHESREWLKVDGRPFDNPHAPDADQDR